jgi:tetratricopeptide (TPR) repeat protein
MFRVMFVLSFQLSLSIVFGQEAPEDCHELHGREAQVNPKKSLPHYELGVCFAKERDYVKATNQFREALNGDLQPAWIEVWSHVNLGKIFDTTGQRERALNEYRLAEETGDNTRGALDEARRYKETPYKEH